MVLRFVSILPLYERSSRPADSALPVAAMMRSRSVDTNKFSCRSGIVTIVPSSFHSGLLVSVGNCTWSEIGCCSRTSVSCDTPVYGRKKKTYRVHVDPILLGIVLSTWELCDTLALRRRDIVRVTFHLISGANSARSIWRWSCWCAERRRRAHRRGRLVPKGLGRI